MLTYNSVILSTLLYAIRVWIQTVENYKQPALYFCIILRSGDFCCCSRRMAYRIYRGSTAAVYCGHPRMVFDQTFAVKSLGNWGNLFGTKTSLKKMENFDPTLHVGNDVIGSAYSIRDLGVILDYVSCQWRNRSAMLPVLVIIICDDNWKLATHSRWKDNCPSGPGFVIKINRLNCCNSIQARLPKSSIMPLQRVQNAV